MLKKVINRALNKLGLHLTFSSNFFGFSIERFINLNKRRAILEAKKHFRKKEIIACEIGTFEGNHALQMLRNLNIKKIYLIDPYEEYEGYINDSSHSKVYLAKIKAHDLLKPFNNKIIWIEKYSDDAVKCINEKLDFLYIDGNHFSPYIDRDIKNYYPLVKKGGIISGHDYGSSYPDVKRAVKKLSKKINKKFLFGLGNDWLILK